MGKAKADAAFNALTAGLDARFASDERIKAAYIATDAVAEYAERVGAVGYRDARFVWGAIDAVNAALAREGLPTLTGGGRKGLT